MCSCGLLFCGAFGLVVWVVHGIGLVRVFGFGFGVVMFVDVVACLLGFTLLFVGCCVLVG